MKGFVLSIVVTAIAFVILLTILPTTFVDFNGQPVELILLSLIMGVVNAVIKPIVKVFSLPITMMTLGLFGFVINAGLLLLVTWLAQNLANIDLTIGGWPTDGFSSDTIVGAFVVSIGLSILTSLIGHFIPD